VKISDFIDWISYVSAEPPANISICRWYGMYRWFKTRILEGYSKEEMKENNVRIT
jgi:hypothetical protein